MHTKEQYRVWRYNPYHYCMRAIVERYVLWLNRHKLTGNVIVEARYKKVDKKLKESFSRIYRDGTENIHANVIQRCLTSREIRLIPKTANIAGLQLVELIAHPSHHGTKARYLDQVMTAEFGKRIVRLLAEKKYCRNPRTRVVDGWGQKWLP